MSVPRIPPERLHLGNDSLASEISAAGPEKLERFVHSLSTQELQHLMYDWNFWARKCQLPPPQDWWVIWLIMAGRGSGKNRAASEYVRSMVEKGLARDIALVGATAADVRDVMVLGRSGVVGVAPPWFMPKYESSKRRVVWPNGASALMFSADEPDRLRGPEFDLAWCDEVAAWRYPEALDMLLMALRLGPKPRCVITTTPRPTKLIKSLLADPSVIVSHSTTYDNRANLPPSFFERIIKKYEGTKLGRQELYAEVLDDLSGTLWNYSMFDVCRADPPGPLVKVVVAIDPAASCNENSDDTGICVAGLCSNGKAYVLADRTCHLPPAEWAQVAIDAYEQFEADVIVGEVNNGGDMVEAVLRAVQPNVPFKRVFASRGKHIRAQPVAALYAQGKVFHAGVFKELEDEMCTWDPVTSTESPNRVDALVYAITELLLTDEDTHTYRIVYEPRVAISPV